ncbi:MAG: aminotransferase class III-fold pyridoxal phosphate-dependent enzyme [Spirochaetaceae bacterium]|nr:MAG: aminotransferase class III-fold pyridoxal phosphate-dependent enzyme [Spirochaetaceae bacterium]
MATGLKPDIITLAKPLGGGLPLSATLLPKKVNDVIVLGEHGTTFGGGPVCATLGLMVWKEITAPGFLEGVREKSKYLSTLLESLKREFNFLGSIRGKGLLMGIEVNIDPEQPEESLRKVIDSCRENGLLILRSGKNVLRIAPALTITKEELKAGVDILREVFSAL